MCTRYRLRIILEPCFYKWYVSGKCVWKEENSSAWRSGLSYVMGVRGWCQHGGRRSISSARLCFYTSGTAGKEPGTPLYTGRSLRWQRKAKIKNARTHKQSPQGETPIRRCSKSRRQDLWQNNGGGEWRRMCKVSSRYVNASLSHIWAAMKMREPQPTGAGLCVCARDGGRGARRQSLGTEPGMPLLWAKQEAWWAPRVKALLASAACEQPPLPWQNVSAAAPPPHPPSALLWNRKHEGAWCEPQRSAGFFLFFFKRKEQKKKKSWRLTPRCTPSLCRSTTLPIVCRVLGTAG